ncbi:hypothetical protein SAMN05192555_110112 [Franzmannia pantelleriensis]|uniref:Helix-turn-helix n=1 Tax=Franzmannia pantelleriensis TaxID=48727 RepID=A0A1G9R901_9GAMM|nr:helix-turn-helix transcriptional regulator [Halomonas pantelleriensis]SDM19713.1 hypothetical protein SAMN05192555_110112 [Halomonas pantelleriensis]
MSTFPPKHHPSDLPEESRHYDDSSRPPLLPWQAVSKAEWEAQQQNAHAIDPVIEPSPPTWHTPPPYPPTEDKRLAEMEQNEPKRRLIRDAKALAKIRKISQAKMAEEMGVSHRTLEEWLQFRRYPRGPGQTLIKRWLINHKNE